MIKNTIIVILLLLLLITFYAYQCLSSNMIDFQKERMEHIIMKEKEQKEKEQKLLSMTDCNDTLGKYKLLLNKISVDLTKGADDMNILTKYVNQTNNSMNVDIERLNKIDVVVVPEKENFNIVDLLDSPVEDGFLTGLDN